MSCDSCKDILLIDEVEPPCWEDACWLPELDERCQRILEIRQKIVTLKELVDAGTILKMYEADLEDIELMAYLEEELKQMRTPETKEPDNG